MDLEATSTEQSPACVTCRNRRVRCDRDQPICGPCRKACVPCRYTHASRGRKRGRPRRMSGMKLDDWTGSATITSPDGPSIQQTAESNSNLEFVNISQPLEAGNVENRAMVRSHVMRNFKQRQKSQRSPTGIDDYIDTILELRPAGSSRRCTCSSSPRYKWRGVTVMDTSTTLDSQSSRRQDDESIFVNYETMPQYLPANQTTATTLFAKNNYCGSCEGLLSPKAERIRESQAIDKQQSYFRGDVFDPFDTLRYSTSRVETRELVHHAVTTLWPSLCPLGTFDPIDKAFMPLVLSDDLVLQAQLFNAGFHLSALQGKKYSVEGMRYRIETIKILNKRLQDPQQAVSDATIAVVTSLLAQAIVTRNVPEIQIHTDGLSKMVKLAGGLEQLGGLGGLLQELVYWTELCAAAITNTGPHFTHPTTYRRLTSLPIFTAPRCPISKMGHGFRDMFTPSKPDLTRPFEDLLELVNQVRCLGWILHISHSCGRSKISLASFLARGAFVKRRIRDLKNPFAVRERADGDSLGHSPGGVLGGKHLFECLRCAVLIFLAFVLDDSPTVLSTLSPAVETLASELVKSIRKLDTVVIQVEHAGFFFWVFGMGAIGGRGKEATRAYFLDLTDRAGRWVGVGSWLEAKSAWIRFLAVEVVLLGPLMELWADVEKRRVRN